MKVTVVLPPSTTEVGLADTVTRVLLPGGSVMSTVALLGIPSW